MTDESTTVRSLDELVAAAERARAAYDWQALTSYAHQALAIEGIPPGTAYVVLDGLAEAHQRLGDLVAEEADLEAMAGLARTLGDKRRPVQALLRQVDLRGRQGRLAEALASAHAALDAARGMDDLALEAESHLALGRLLARFGRYQEQRSAAQQAMTLFNTLEDPVGEAKASLILSQAGPASGVTPERLAQSLAALEMCRRMGEREAEASALNSLGIATADFAERRAWYAQALAIYDTIGDRRGQAQVHNNLALTYGQMGLYALARDDAAAAVEVARGMGARVDEAYYLETLARTYLDMGDPGTAEALFRQGIPLAEEVGDPFVGSADIFGVARALTLLGRPADALDLYREAVRLLGTNDLVHEQATCLAWLGAASLELGDVAAAQDHTAHAVSLVEGVPGGGTEYPPQDIWWHRYRALAATADPRPVSSDERTATDDTWGALDRARELMLLAVASLSDDGLRRNYLNKVAINRQIVEEWVRQAVQRGVPLAPLTDALAGPGGAEAQFERMLDIGVRLNARREASGLARFIVEQVVELTGAERVLLYRIDDEDRRQMAAEFAVENLSPLSLPGRGAGGEGDPSILDAVSLKRQAILRHAPPDAPPLEQQSILCVPLTAAGKLVGLVYADMAGLYGRFTERDRTLLTLLANQAAVALENAVWAESLEQRVEERTAELQAANAELGARNAELAVMNRMQQGLARQLDLEAAIDLVGDTLRDLFEGSAVFISLYEQASNRVDTHYFVTEDGRRIRPESLELGKGLTSIVIKTRRPHVFGTLEEMVALGAVIEEPDKPSQEESWMGVPILVGERVIGVVAVQDYPRHRYTEADARLLSTITASMGVALENARLFEETHRLLQETRQRAVELATVNRVSQALTSQLDLEALIQLVGEQVRTVFNADIAYVALVDRQANEIHFPYQFGEKLDPLPLGKGLTSRVLESREPLLINRDIAERRAALGIAQIGIEPQSYLGVPIVVGEDAIGILSVQSTTEEGRFDEDDLRLLGTIAANVGGALQNARLYRESERRAFQMATIAEVGREVSSTLELEAVLKGIAGHVHSLFQAQDTVLRLLDAGEDVFRTIVALGRYAGEFMADVVTFGEGIAGHVALSGLAEVVDDTVLDPRGVHVAGTSEADEFSETLMCAPLIARGKTVGLLSVYRDRAQGLFTQVDLDFLVALVREAATAIENARLFQAEQRRAEQFRLIGEVGRRMIALLPVDDLLKEIARLVKETAGYYLVGIGLIEGDELVFKAGAGAVWEMAEFQPPRIRVGQEGITGCVAATGEPLLVPDLSQESRYYGLPETSEMQSELAVPLKTKERVIGVLHVQSDRLNAFDDTDLALLQALAHQAAIAIENARLFGEVQAQKWFSESLVQNTPVAIVTATADSAVTSWNPAAERLFGYTQEEVLGHDLDALVTTADMRAEARGFSVQTQAGDAVHAVTRRVRKDGSLVDVELLSVPARVAGQEAGYIAIYHDISELTAATRAIQESERRMADIIDFLPDATLVIDREGKVIAWNRAMEEMTGIRASEMIGKGEHEYALPFYRERRPILIDLVLLPDREIEARYAHVQRDGSTLIGEALVPALRGERAYLYATASALRDSQGEIVGAIETIRDISDRKQAEEELQQAKAEAEAATQAKSAFLATMSHEIRTPMNAVIGMTSLLLDTPLNAEQRDFAETIRTSGDALLTVINDILDFSKIEAGRIELDRQPFDVRGCVESALSLVAGQAAAMGLELGCWIDPQVPAGIVGDETRLRQIVLNLLSNAVKFTDSGEVLVSMSATPIPEREAGPEYEIHVAVRDTGLGIPPDRMDRLFQSFSQVDSSTTRKYGGTGLGLAISQRLAELMGGRMWAESAGIPGQGSTFHFVFRAQAAAIPLRAELEARSPDMHGRRVLIVDDNATNRRILTLQTEGWGMVPHATGSPAEALAWVRRGNPFDVAIVDWQMPEMDGATLAEEVQKINAGLPVLMVSSLGRGEVEESKRFAAFLLKPVRASQLYNTLTGILASHPEAKPPTSAERASEFDAEMAARHPLRILLAEDNAVNQKLALRLLERLGYRADVAANGLEAVRALERQPYDVVFMDVQMPEMDGLEATREIVRRWPSGERPRIIAVTANAMAEDREVCLAAGMDDYLAKPIRVDELVAALSRSQVAGTGA